MADELKKGDTVKLKSGGPLMTVENIGDYPDHGIEDGIGCIWFDGRDTKEKVFDRAVLERVDPDNTPRRVVRG